MKLDKTWIVITAMIVIAAGSRFLPHWHNFTAVGAMGLFGAAYFKQKYWSLLVPLLALWVSDLILNNVVYGHYYEGFVWFGANVIWVYAGFAAIVGVGLLLLKVVKPGRVLLAAVLASVAFFLISNFGSFVLDPGGIYPNSSAGLLSAYAAGLPFFWNSLLANIVFSCVLFGIYEFAILRRPLELTQR